MYFKLNDINTSKEKPDTFPSVLTSPLSRLLRAGSVLYMKLEFSQSWSNKNIVWSEIKTSPDPKCRNDGVLAIFSQRFGEGGGEVQCSMERGNDALCFPIILSPRSDAHGTHTPPFSCVKRTSSHSQGVTLSLMESPQCSSGGRLSSNLRGSCQSHLPMLGNKKERNRWVERPHCLKKWFPRENRVDSSALRQHFSAKPDSGAAKQREN